MSKRWTLGVAIAVCAGSVTMAHGQQSQKSSPTAPEWMFIVEEHVKPSMIEQYESATKAMIEELEEHEISPEQAGWKTVAGPELGYVYVIPIESMGAMDKMMENWQKTMQTLGDRWTELESKSTAATSHRATYHVVRRPDLSYMPAEPRVAEDEVKYVAYGFYYTVPGKEQDLEKVAKDYAALYKRKGLKDSWRIYQAVTGGDLPLYVVAHPAKSMSDFASRSEQIQEMLGEEGQYLGQQAMACTRRVDKKDGWLRPDLSYPRSK